MTDKPEKPFVRDNGEGGKHVKTLTMERLKDGTQQYIRGDTPRQKIRNANTAYREKIAGSTKYRDPVAAGKMSRVSMDYAEGDGKSSSGDTFDRLGQYHARQLNRLDGRKKGNQQ